MNLKKEIITHWGKEYEITPVLLDEITPVLLDEITPVLLDEIFGDGKQIIYIEPLNTRPDFYVAKIDSSIDIEDNDQAIDYLEEYVLDYIEEIYGIGSGDSEPFPALDTNCGYSFGRYEL